MVFLSEFEIGSVFSVLPLNPKEMEFVAKNKIDVIHLNFDRKLVGPFRFNGGLAYYIDHEINLSKSDYSKDKKQYFEIFESIPYGATVIFSPYIFNPNINPEGFRIKILKLYKAFVEKRPDLKFISAVQDGVGCSGHPQYVEWGYGDRSIFSKDYIKMIKLLKIHREVCESLGMIAQINIELFEYDKGKGNWVFADPQRIFIQILMSGHTSSSNRLGPCFAINGMSEFYDSSRFIDLYKIF